MISTIIYFFLSENVMILNYEKFSKIHFFKIVPSAAVHWRFFVSRAILRSQIESKASCGPRPRLIRRLSSYPRSRRGAAQFLIRYVAART